MQSFAASQPAFIDNSAGRNSGHSDSTTMHRQQDQLNSQGYNAGSQQAAINSLSQQFAGLAASSGSNMQNMNSTASNPMTIFSLPGTGMTSQYGSPMINQGLQGNGGQVFAVQNPNGSYAGWNGYLPPGINSFQPGM
jgi:hypothetical protein